LGKVVISQKSAGFIEFLVGCGRVHDRSTGGRCRGAGEETSETAGDLKEGIERDTLPE
jgi:hypothetical protein